MQRKKANPPSLKPISYPRPLVQPEERKHPFWQLLSPDEYLIATANFVSPPPSRCAMCKKGMKDVIAGEKEMIVQMADQDTSSEMDLERVLLPDVAFVQAANNLVYEPRYASVVVSTNMMTDELLILSHPTPPKTDGGNSKLPPP
jgi:hypothetical protein